MADEALPQGVRGELIDSGNPGYERARALYNAAIQRRPRLIVRCRDAADVMAVVQHARTAKLPLAIRGGGHSGAGLSSVDDGIVADLSAMRGVRIDPQARLIRVEGGALLGDVDHASSAFGLAVPAGVVSTTGVGGLTLGGGHGYLTRKYGLTVDNLVEADVVLADGRLVTASAEKNADLFWALRGGGGNFGVVTSFLFRGAPVKQVYAGPLLWPAERTLEVMGWYRDVMRDAPEDLYLFCLVMKIPPAPPFPPELHGRPVCGVVLCHLGSVEEAKASLARARPLGPPLLEMHGPMPLPALNSMFDPLLPPGLQWFWKGLFVKELSDAAIAVHAEYAARIPSTLSTMHMYAVDGAPSRVAPAATAFAHRDARWSLVIGGIDPDPKRLPDVRAWAQDYWTALKPHSLGAGYVNFMQDEGDDRVRATYGQNYYRLVEVKTKYDPKNLFRVNWNIKPRG
jgi:hypothetical protein